MPQLDIYIFNEALNNNLRLFLVVLLLNIVNLLLKINVLLKIFRILNIFNNEILYAIYEQYNYIRKSFLIEIILSNIKIKIIKN